MTKDEETNEEIRLADLALTVEFACWTAVLLAPFFRLVYGPPVTNDQWAIQVFLFSSALLGACGLRVYRVLNRR